jgi:hypothetical protein
MKLVKKKYSNPASSMHIFGIPILSYIIQKSIGMISNGKDMYWLICISLTFLVWLIINFKLTKNK